MSDSRSPRVHPLTVLAVGVGLLGGCSDGNSPPSLSANPDSSGGTTIITTTSTSHMGGSGATNTSTSGTNDASVGGTYPSPDCSTDANCAVSERCALLHGATKRGCFNGCTADSSCLVGFECVPDLYANPVCARACDPNETDPCASEETCHADSSSSRGGFCIFAGSQTEGAACGTVELTCAPGLECVYPELPLLGVPRCAASCSVSATPGSAKYCEAGSCRAIADDRGGCIVGCDPFANDSCSDDWVCEAAFNVVVIDAETGQGQFTGQCVIPGNLSAGSPCSGGDCAAGLTCGPILNDYGVTFLTCGAPCSAAHPCTEGICASLGLSVSGQGDYGTCQSSCTNVGESCSATEWCAPSLTTPGLGVCVTPGPAGKDDECLSSAQCGKGLRCDTSTRICRSID